MSKETFLPQERIIQLNAAVSPMLVNFRFVPADNLYKAGDDPVSGTEIYILPATEQLLKACKADKNLFRAQPVGKGVGTTLTQFHMDASRNQPVVNVGGVKVMQSSLMGVLSSIAIDWGLLEWYTYVQRAGMRFVCGNPDGSKIIIDYRPQKPSPVVVGSVSKV